MQAMIEVTDETFEAEVLKASTPVLVDFWNNPCPGCVVVLPWLEAFAEEFGDRVKIVKAFVPRNLVTVEGMNIRGVPHFLVFQRGKVVARQPGLPDRSRLHDWIERAISDRPESARAFQWVIENF